MYLYVEFPGVINELIGQIGDDVGESLLIINRFIDRWNRNKLRRTSVSRCKRNTNWEKGDGAGKSLQLNAYARPQTPYSFFCTVEDGTGSRGPNVMVDQGCLYVIFHIEMGPLAIQLYQWYIFCKDKSAFLTMLGKMPGMRSMQLPRSP